MYDGNIRPIGTCSRFTREGANIPADAFATHNFLTRCRPHRGRADCMVALYTRRPHSSGNLSRWLQISGAHLQVRSRSGWLHIIPANQRPKRTTTASWSSEIGHFALASSLTGTRNASGGSCTSAREGVIVVQGWTWVSELLKHAFTLTFT